MIVVDVGGDLDLDMAGAHHAGDDGFDALAQRVLVIGGVLVLAAGHGVGTGLVVAAGQQVAVVVDDGDTVGGEGGDGGRHQVLDRLDLAAVHA